LPRGLAFDTAGNLFVAEYFNARILGFTPAASKSIYATGIDGPQWLAFETATGIILKNPTTLPCGAFQFSFTNTPGATFTAWASTNVMLPLSSWTALGYVPEISSGQYQFTDTNAPASVRRFYCVSSP